MSDKLPSLLIYTYTSFFVVITKGDVHLISFIILLRSSEMLFEIAVGLMLKLI